MRFTISLIAFICALPVQADVISVPSKVTQVTMHPDSATILRMGSVDIPEGKHRLVLRGVPDSADTESLRVSVDGVRQIGTVIREDFAPPHDATSPEVEAAEERIEDIEKRIRNVRDDAAQARAAVAASEVSIEFLRKLGENESMAEAGADALRDIARMIREEAGEASQAALDAELRAREIEEALKDLNEELEDATQALAAIALEDADRLYIAIEVSATEPVISDLTLSYLVDRETFWLPTYDLNLVTGDDPKVEIKSNAWVRQETGENWTDVTLRLSTTEATGQIAARILYPSLRRIEEPRPVLKQRELSAAAPMAMDAGSLEEPVVEPPVIVEEAGGGAEVWSESNLILTYSEPVSIASGADVLKLQLDSFTQDADVLAMAVPIYDETAYRIARMVNSTGRELIPAQHATHYVDGQLVGFEAFDGLTSGQEADIGFGPIEGLRLKRDVLDQNEGDRGILTRSNQREDRIEVEVENLTYEEWPLRILDRVPYSQQEDLEIQWVARPKPSEMNVDKQRGILAWDLNLAPGQSQTIQLDTTLNWPEGMILR
ncbi:MAG: mucoidy inhibitor MuiA family protein [Paracoccaceae bacterium]